MRRIGPLALGLPLVLALIPEHKDQWVNSIGRCYVAHGRQHETASVPC